MTLREWFEEHPELHDGKVSPVSDGESREGQRIATICVTAGRKVTEIPEIHHESE